MYDTLIAEVRAAVEEEYAERLAIILDGGPVTREAEQAAAHLVAYGTLPPDRRVQW